MSIAYHRRWYWKFLCTSYLCSFSAGWLLVHQDWRVGLSLCALGFIFGFLAGREASQARREAGESCD